jgi:hypothetical protein
MSVSPTSVRVIQGETAIFTVTVQSESEFSSQIEFRVHNPPGPLLPGSGWNPATVTLLPSASATSTLTMVTSDQTSIRGPFYLQLEASGGGITHNRSVVLNVDPPPVVGDFSMSISPARRTMTQGETATFEVTVQSLSGFNSPVGLFVLFPGFTPGPGTGLKPATVTPPPNGSATSTFTLVTDNRTPTDRPLHIGVGGTHGRLSRGVATIVEVNPPPGN